MREKLEAAEHERLRRVCVTVCVCMNMSSYRRRDAPGACRRRPSARPAAPV